ncbi:MAG: hypothetical protein K6E58_04045 [Eubacterium sp.]|nr:hypothetical protein [Eubacterium sp.]
MSKFEITKGNPLKLGATIGCESINFAFASDSGKEVELLLYKKGSNRVAKRIPFEEKVGNVFCMSVKGIDYKEYDYNFAVDGQVVTDPYVKATVGKKEWETAPKLVKGAFVCDCFDWGKDKKLNIPFDETIMYRLHVRGFTKSKTSKVKNKGTYQGVIEKIPHFKELGINLVELMPAYDFNEKEIQPATSMVTSKAITNPTLNYWGYTGGFAFAPKASFAADLDAVTEFKEMVKALHKEGIEVSMEFYFTYGTSPQYILDALHYWVLEYHIDGIHVNCEDTVMKMIERDPVLSDTKIFTYVIPVADSVYAQVDNRNFADFNDDFMVAVRKFVKGDEDMLGDISQRIKRNPNSNAVVNYVANHNTFTLYDAVSYDKKYNMENGENNNDGAIYNYSWNCGDEGDTRKRTVMELRKHQIKNMLSLVFLSQGVPMIYAGDEMCNSQKGNNNPYCLDNEISWTNWNTTAIAKEIFEFTKSLIEFRKANKVLHLSEETKQIDHASLGLPDLSYHGTRAWAGDFAHFNRHLGVMLCGAYAKLDKKKKGDDIYIAYNMYWTPMTFGMPAAGKNKKWDVAFSTDKQGVAEKKIDKNATVPARTTTVFVAVDDKK